VDNLHPLLRFEPPIGCPISKPMTQVHVNTAANTLFRHLVTMTHDNDVEALCQSAGGEISETVLLSVFPSFCVVPAPV